MKVEYEVFRELLYCDTCKGKTRHSVIFQHKEESVPGEDLDWRESHYITECMGCRTKLFIREYGDEMMLDYDEQGEMFGYTNIYRYSEKSEEESNSSYKSLETKDFINTPELINTLYNQVVNAFNSKMMLLVAAGLRMIVEGICKDLDISSGFVLDENGVKKIDREGNELRRKNLVGKINGLVEKNIIVQPQANILHQIRELGNITVHELEVPSEKTVRNGIAVIDIMIHHIYELKEFDIYKSIS